MCIIAEVAPRRMAVADNSVFSGGQRMTSALGASLALTTIDRAASLLIDRLSGSNPVFDTGLSSTACHRRHASSALARVKCRSSGVASARADTTQLNLGAQ